jgi:sugar (pentulose or hexulose) kinase
MSEPSFVITLDIGGSAAKAYAYDVVGQRAFGRVSVSYPKLCAGADPGSFEPDKWWGAAVRVLESLVQKLDVPSSSYCGLTVSTIRIPFVLLDRQGLVIGPSLLNKDRRALRDVDDAVVALGATHLYEVTGHFGAPEFGLAKLLWFRRTYPDAWSSVATVLQLHDWFVYQLSGEMASEPSSAAMSQMFDVANGVWATELLDNLGLPSDLFPEIHKAGTQIGGLVPTAAAQTGLPVGLPVHIGGGDTHLSAISAGAWDPHIPVVVAGTTSPVHVALDFIPPIDERFPLLLSEHALAGRWILESNAGATGGIVSGTVDLAEETGAQLEATLLRRGFVLDRSADVALTVISGNPYFGPEGWAKVARPTIFGLRPEHSGADVYTAALQGGSNALRAVLSTLVSRLRLSPPFIRMTGGMSTSPRWCQAIADVTKTNIIVRPLDEVAGLGGAALVVGEDLVDNSSHITEEIFHPRPSASRLFEEEYETYLELYSLACHQSTEEDVKTDARAR